MTAVAIVVNVLYPTFATVAKLHPTISAPLRRRKGYVRRRGSRRFAVILAAFERFVYGMGLGVVDAGRGHADKLRIEPVGVAH
jgi:hypothetical protein